MSRVQGMTTHFATPTISSCHVEISISRAANSNRLLIYTVLQPRFGLCWACMLHVYTKLASTFKESQSQNWHFLRALLAHTDRRRSTRTFISYAEIIAASWTFRTADSKLNDAFDRSKDALQGGPSCERPGSWHHGMKATSWNCASTSGWCDRQRRASLWRASFCDLNLRILRTVDPTL